MPKLHLVLLIHAHQPVGNFDQVIEQAYQRCYLPFLDALTQHPAVRLGLHYSGPLLEWIEEKHPDCFDLLRELIGRGQVELLGGGFYEPVLIAIPPEDQLEQVRRMAEYLEKHFGRRPAGAWLAERVWEPQLASRLAEAGVEYTLVDDVNFLASGFELEELYGYYIAEDLGSKVKVIPGWKSLRYLIPFRSVEETMEFLRRAAEQYPDGMAAMGDDCEKFGVWPGTYEHCYRDGWLEKFFTALEGSSDWLVTTPPGDYLAQHLALGRADLLAASYSEMMEWALPTPVRQRFHAVQQEFAARPDVLNFLRGGFWRGFFRKYPESNLLHKKMLYVSSRVRELAETRRRSPLRRTGRRALDQAAEHVLRAQCNDAYWHGVFGGIYAPHLRTALWRELVRAEKLADATAHGRAKYAEVRRLDFDADGAEEIYVTTPQCAALVKPSDGGTIAALDFRPRDVTLINSFERRPEAYHARLRQAAAADAGGIASIHEQTRVKEPGLAERLRYDRWPRHAFRLLLFSPWKRIADYDAVMLEESAAFAGGAYECTAASGKGVNLVCEGPLHGPAAAGELADPELRVVKKYSFTGAGDGFVVECDFSIAQREGPPLKLQVGLEVVLNLLAANEPDRFFETASGERHPLGWGGAIPASQLRVVDEWQDVAATLEAPGAAQYWVAPIETVSESEEGFERVYQGSQILAVWPVELAAGVAWTGRVTLRVAPAR